MKIRDLFTQRRPLFSFEFFPPKTEAGAVRLADTVHELKLLCPGFVSVTYGAGGSTRDRTLDLVTSIKQRTAIEAMAHLTCVGHTREELAAVLDRLRDQQVENVLVLRGDPPAGSRRFEPTQGGFRYAS